MLKNLLLAGIAGSIISVTSAAWAENGAQSATSRTFYESMQLGTARSAAEAFIKAYSRADFFTLYFLLSPEAQKSYSEKIRDFRMSQLLIDDFASFRLSKSFGDDHDAKDWNELANDEALLFDDVLYAAYRSDNLPFTIPASTELSAIESDNKDVTVFKLTTNTKPPAIFLELIRLNSSRWKVDRVRWEGSSNVSRPWGIHPEDK